MNARENTVKSKVLEFVAQNPGLSRKEYLKAFVELGLSVKTASMYHFKFVTKPGKLIKVEVKKGPVRDPKTGRFLKKVVG